MENVNNAKQVESILSSFLKWALRKYIISLKDKNMPVVAFSTDNCSIRFGMARSTNCYFEHIDIKGKYKGYRYNLNVYYDNYENIENLKLEIKDFIIQYVKTKRENIELKNSLYKNQKPL